MSIPAHPPEIEAIIRLVQIDGNNNLAKLLREYIDNLREGASLYDAMRNDSGEPGSLVKTNDEVPAVDLGVEVERAIDLLNTEDTQRLDALETLAVPSGKTKRRIQIFFEGSLRDWIDAKMAGE